MFDALNGWVLKGNKGGNKVSKCGGKFLIGGYDVWGKDGIAEKNF